MKLRWLGVALAAGALAFAGCGDDEDEAASGGSAESTPAATATAEKFPADSTLGKIQAKGEITIGVKFDVPPFGVKNPQSGEVEGFDVEMGKAVAAKLGVKPKFIEAISDNRIPFLEDGTADLILSTMTINEERVEQIEFSDPYFIARGRVLVPADSEITGVADLGGKNVCTALGSTYEATLKTQAPEAKLKLVDSYSECLELVQNGAVDAVSTDDVILTGMIIQDDTLKMVGDPLTQEPYGAGIKKGETEVVDVRQRGLPGPQGRRNLDEALRAVDRQVHRRARRAADDHRRRGRGARQEERHYLSDRPRSAAARADRHAHRPLARVPLGLLGHGAHHRGLVRDRDGRRHARGGTADRAVEVAAAARRDLRRGLPQHPAARAAVHLLRRPAPGRGGRQRLGGGHGIARPVHGGVRRRRRCARASSRSARARSRPRSRSGSPTPRRCAGSCSRRPSARSSRRSAR